MKINLHKNARTTPAQRELIQNSPGMSIAALASHLGVSETTVRRWKNRASVYDKSHAPKKVYTALTQDQELAVVLIRLALRSGLDDLLGIVRRFILARCSRSSLSRCLSRYDTARLAPMTPRLASEIKDFRGTYFYHTKFHLPSQVLTHTPLVIDALLDCSFRCAFAQISPLSGQSSLPFIQKTFGHFPVAVRGLISAPPFFLGDPEPQASCRRQSQVLEHFCHIRKIDYCAVDLMPRPVLEHLKQACDAMKQNQVCFSPPLRLEQIRNRIGQALTAYHLIPQQTLRQRSPFQALQHHYQDFPGSFVGKPTNLLGLPEPLPQSGRHGHHSCLTPLGKDICMVPNLTSERR